MSAVPWSSEAELVADFTAWAQHQGWTAYAETAGWDVLLVRNEDGFQVGVEAKMSLNALVLCQALSRESDYRRGEGPDCIAILVPERKCINGMSTLARHLSLVVVQGYSNGRFSPELPERRDWRGSELAGLGWPERCPDVRCKLPDYVPDVTGGHASPITLTEWKIKALKVAILLEVRGFVTRADFKHLRIDPSRWTQYWLKSAGDKRWIATAKTPNFQAQHPKNYEQIKADLDKWEPAVPADLLAGAA